MTRSLLWAELKKAGPALDLRELGGVDFPDVADVPAELRAPNQGVRARSDELSSLETMSCPPWKR